MNKFIFASLIVLPTLLFSQNLETRKTFNQWVKMEINQPCYSLNNAKIFSTSNPLVGNRTPNSTLRNFQFGNFDITLEFFFFVGENDCFGHQMWLYSKSKRTKIDSLMVDYIGDSEGYVNIESIIKPAKENFNIEINKIEEIAEDRKTPKRVSKKLFFKINEQGNFEVLNNEPIFSMGGNFYTLAEYNREFASSKSLEIKKIKNNLDKNGTLLLKTDNRFSIFRRTKNNFYTYITSIDNTKNLKLNNFEGYSDGIVITTNEEKVNKSYYFKFNGKDFDFDKKMTDGVLEKPNAREKSLKKIWDF